MDVEPSPSAHVAQAPEFCVICLDHILEPCEAQPCRHTNFDFLCLTTWLEHQPLCPICKRDVHQVLYALDEDDKQGKVYIVPPPKTVSTCESGQAPGTSDTATTSRPAHTRRNHSSAIRKRRLVYQYGLLSFHVGSNRRQPKGSRYREELSPQLFRSDPELEARARTWLHRELCVFEFLHRGESPPSPPPQPHTHTDSSVGGTRANRSGKARFLVEYIIAILRNLDMQGSTGQAENMIQEFLGRHNTRILLHELRAWLRSPARSLCEWDHVVQYSRNLDEMG